MKICKATKEDLVEIAKLYEKEMSKQFLAVEEKPIKCKEYEKILLRNFRKSRMFVLKDNEISGFIWFYKKGKEYNLEEIFVTNKKRGFGRTLIEFMVNEAKRQRVERINLNVHVNNNNARSFFKKFGFSERTIEMGKEIRWKAL